MQPVRRRFHSVKIKIIVPLLVILLAVFLISSLVIIDRESKSAQETILKNANSFSSLSAAYIIDNYQLYYESGFYKFIEIMDNLMVLNRDLTNLQITDVNGHILFDSSEITNGKYDEQTLGARYLDNETLAQAGEPTSTLTFNQTARNFTIVQPYFEEWGRHDYSVKYGFSLANLDIATNGMILTIALYSGIFILISFLLIFLLFNIFVTSPIAELTKGVRKMGAGTLDTPVQIRSKDELGELATAFNTMNTDLKISRERLEEYSKDLEKLVAKRTQELEEKTIRLEQINHDLTVAREELNSLNKSLEERVAQRTNEVEKLLKQKDEFIIQLGHDLKHPLGPLINLIPLLEQQEESPEKKEMLTVLHRNADYMKNLVLKTLELAVLNSPNTRFSLEPLNLSDTVSDILEKQKLVLSKTHAHVEHTIKPDIFVQADRLRLEELITNIIDNSIKYCQAECKITITAERKNDTIEIAIRDTGIGMTKEQLEAAFDEFYKADTSRHDIQSAGLGLSICKRIVEKHGGTIWVKSPGLNQGTTVYFTLPTGEKP
jgi:signal transduction histidine kinase